MIFLCVLFLLKIIIKNNGLNLFIFLRIIIDKLNNAGVAMTGEIDSIDIIEYKDNNIATIKHLKLIN